MTPGEWIEWPGGSCPLPPETPVEVRFRCGAEDCCEKASAWAWDHSRHNPEAYDIVAYRVVEVSA